MTQQNLPRLLSAAKEFNIGQETLINYLLEKGFQPDELKPTSRLSEDMYQALQNAFQPDKSLKIKSALVELPRAVGNSLAEKLIEKAYIEESSFLDLGNLDLSRLPDSISVLKDSLKTLILGNQYLNDFNHVVFSRNKIGKNFISDLSILEGFTMLENLFLGETQILGIEQLANLTQLKKLDISYVQNISPKSLMNFKNLITLDISGCKIKIIDDLFPLRNLEILNASNCALNSLPHFSSQTFPELKILNLSYNRNLNPWIQRLNGLINLKKLFLEEMSLENQKNFISLSKLEHLSVKGNNLSDGNSFSYLRNLKKLNISKNNFKSISFAATLKNLRELIANENKIEVVPKSLNTTNLETLILSNNQISTISHGVNFEKLKYLELSGNKIQNISSISSCLSAKYLSLSNNKISNISPLKKLSHIETIYLSNNKIEDLSPLANLLKEGYYDLEYAYYEQKSIDYEDIDFTAKKFIQQLFIANNPISNPPIQYLQAGTKAVIAYWAQEEKANNKNEVKIKANEAKLIIVGNSHVGKSTLSHYFKYNKLPNKNLPSTHGIEFSSWQPTWRINGEQFSINIIDFGGQEYYHDTHHLFFTDKAAYLLIWNPQTNLNKKIHTPIGDRTQITEIRHFDFEYWLNAIEIYSESSKTESNLSDKSLCPVLLVQTFTDQNGKKQLNLRDLTDKYPQLFDSISISLKANDYNNLDLLELEIKKMYEQIHKTFNQVYYESWINFKKYIEKEFSDNYSILSIQQFTSFFNSNSGTSNKYTTTDIKIVCITLNYWGVILYKYEIEELNNYVIINPQAFTKRINELLAEDLRKDDGVIFEKDVGNKLRIDSEKAREVLKFLKYFKIIFELPRKTEDQELTYISPMYLSESPKYLDLLLDNFIAYFKIVFEGYFHKGILLDCFKELGKNLYFESGQYFYWQWGMVLKRDNTIVCIEFDKDNLKHILIKVSRSLKEQIGDNEFIKDVFQAFTKITSKYKIDIQFSIDGTKFISKLIILKMLNNGLNKVEIDSQIYSLKGFLPLLKKDELPPYNKRIFVSYSSKDRVFVDELILHLELLKEAGICNYWIDLKLNESEEWNPQIMEEMEKANIILMLLSPGYLSTRYILENEVPIAIKFLEDPKKGKQIFWILLKPCSYEVFPNISKYSIFPLKEHDMSTNKTQQKSISEYPNRDRKWVEMLKLIVNEDTD